MLFATAACIFSTSELQKVVRNWRVLYILTCKCAFRHSGLQFFDIWTWSEHAILTCKCAFRHSGVHFFDIWTSKSAPGPSVFLTFSLPNVLFATAAYNFSTSELQKVLRNWRVLYTFASKCAFRHSGVQFLIFALTTWLRTRRFNRPTFRLTRHTNHWKNTAFRDFSNIWRGCIFFLLTFALLHLLSADLTTLLCFSTVHSVGSFYLNFLRLLLLLLLVLLLLLKKERVLLVLLWHLQVPAFVYSSKIDVMWCMFFFYKLRVVLSGHVLGRHQSLTALGNLQMILWDLKGGGWGDDVLDNWCKYIRFSMWIHVEFDSSRRFFQKGFCSALSLDFSPSCWQFCHE